MLLDEIVAFVDAAHEDPSPPALIRVIDQPGGEPELAVRPLDDMDPHDALLGFTAPASWSAIGLVAGGWATHPGGRDRVRTTVAVDRSGHTAGIARVDGQPPITDPPSEGWIIDWLRRAVGVPTSPPTTGIAAWRNLRWLDDVAKAARAGQVRLRDALSLRDAIPEVPTWGELRRLVMCEAYEIDDVITPRLAFWMDEGSFSRWLVGELPDTRQLMAELRRQFPCSTYERILELCIADLEDDQPSGAT